MAAVKAEPIALVVRVEAARWRRAVPGAAKLVERAARAAIRGGARKQAGEIALVLADDATVKRLNRDYRGKDKPTNVLSFPMGGEPGPDGEPAALGDVVLALETIQAEAKAQGKRVADHVSHLAVHGVLHLLGFDHEKDAPARRMEALETRILASLGIADPYRPRRVAA